MTRDSRIVLEEMIEVIDQLQESVRYQSYEEFEKDWILRHAAQRGLEIISEASRHLPESFRAMEPEIDWPQIRAIGNLLRHEYHKTSDRVVWQAVTKHLDELRPVLVRLLTRL